MLGVGLNWAHPLNKGLVGYWAMQEGMGNKVYDLSGNGNTGTLTGMAFPPTAASGWNPGRKGIGLQFDGADDYVDAGNAASLNITNAITVSAWVKKSANPDAYGNIVGKGYVWQSWGDESDWGAFEMTQYSDGRVFWGVRLQSASSVQRETTTAINEWTYLVGTFQVGNYIKIYKDGVLVSSASTGASPIKTNAHPVRIGGLVLPGYYFNGSIDDVRIYNRALSASEILELYINPYGMFL